MKGLFSLSAFFHYYDIANAKQKRKSNCGAICYKFHNKNQAIIELTTFSWVMFEERCFVHSLSPSSNTTAKRIRMCHKYGFWSLLVILHKTSVTIKDRDQFLTRKEPIPCYHQYFQALRELHCLDRMYVSIWTIKNAIKMRHIKSTLKRMEKIKRMILSLGNFCQSIKHVMIRLGLIVWAYGFICVNVLHFW